MSVAHMGEGARERRPRERAERSREAGESSCEGTRFLTGIDRWRAGGVRERAGK